MSKATASKVSAMKTHSREALEKMSRAQIQAVAKAWSIKANIKTQLIIDQLIVKMDVPVDIGPTKTTTTAPVSGSLHGTVAGAMANDRDEHNAPTAQGEQQAEAVVKREQTGLQSTPDQLGAVEREVVAQADIEKERAFQNWQRELIEWESPPREVPMMREARSLTSEAPLFPLPPVTGIAASLPLGETTPTEDDVMPLPVTTPTARPGAPSPEDISGASTSRQPVRAIGPLVAGGARNITRTEMRKVLRHLARLGNEKTSQLEKLSNSKKLYDYMEGQCHVAMESIVRLRSGYDAVENVAKEMKDDPTVVDGTGQLDDDAWEVWTGIIDENFEPVSRRVKRRQEMIDAEEDEEEGDFGEKKEVRDAHERECSGSAAQTPPVIAVASAPQPYVDDDPDDIYV